MNIPVSRYKRAQKIGDPDSPELFYLRQEPGSSKTFNEEYIAKDVEALSALSKDDVLHAFRAFVRRMKIILTEGNKVKIDGFGTFYTTFSCEGTEEEKDCTVKNIRKVHIRFAVDNKLRLVNDSTASTRGGDNNVKYFIRSEKAEKDSSGNGGNNSGGGNNPGGGGNPDDEFEDPTA